MILRITKDVTVTKVIDHIVQEQDVVVEEILIPEGTIIEAEIIG